MMVLIAIFALILGVLCGLFLFTDNIVIMFDSISNITLYILMLSVGVAVGGNKLILKKMREYNLTVLFIPFGIIVGSVIGGFASAFILNMTFADTVSISCGLGWYSLSGILVSDLAGAQAGTIAFLSNLFREIISFMIIPIIAKVTNEYTVIAPAGATSEDTTLPMIMKYTREDIVIISVINGMLCSAVVPFIIPMMYNLLK